jgi:hypothetical protein
MFVLAFMLQAEPVDTLIVRAENPAGGRAELQATEELRIGSLQGPVETSFGYVETVAVAADGTLYVPDTQVPAVRVFDPDGVYLGDIGREGEGPGEYIAIRGIGVLPTGEIAVWHEMGDITVFDEEGQFVRRFSARLSGIAGGVGPGLVPDAAGLLYIRTITGPPPATTPRYIHYAWVRYSADGEFVDSIVPPDRRLEGSPFAFRTETVSVPSPHGYFVTARNSGYGVYRPLRDGRVLRIERSYEQVPIEGDERAQWERYLAELEVRRGERFAPIAAAKPPWKQLHVGADGRIWVRRYARAEHVPGHETRSAAVASLPTVEWVEPARFDILDPGGTYLGSVELPPEGELAFARGPHVWMLERGDFDEFYVVRYRIDGLGRPE